MKILLLGEYSGFYKNLSIGLKGFGHQVDWYADGDGFKQIDGQTANLHKSKSKYDLWIDPFVQRKRFRGYDVVQMVCPDVFSIVPNRIMFDYIKKNNKKVYISLAGTTHTTYEWFKNYAPMLNPNVKDRYQGIKLNLSKSNEKHVLTYADGLIPIMYEYSQGYDEFKNMKSIIPLPIDVESIPYQPNIVRGKIVIFHGLNREEAKGTPFIREAMRIIQEKYPDEVETVIEGKMPLKDYLDLMNKTNVVIDQCKNFSWGMNSCYAMAQGKIVLAPGRDESLAAFGLQSSPIRQIGPNVSCIVEQLERIIKEKNFIEQYGLESRRFVEEIHDCNKIAKKYIDCWNETN